MTTAEKEMIELLQAIQWVKADKDAFCPCCMDWQSNGHSEECTLAAILDDAALKE